MTGIVDKGTIATQVFLESIFIPSQQIQYYKLDLIHVDQTEIQLDVQRGIQDWGIAWWISTIPVSNGYRQFNITTRSDLSLFVNKNILEVRHLRLKSFDFFTIDPNLDYYINFVNLQGSDNYYHIRTILA